MRQIWGNISGNLTPNQTAAIIENKKLTRVIKPPLKITFRFPKLWEETLINSITIKPSLLIILYAFYLHSIVGTDTSRYQRDLCDFLPNFNNSRYLTSHNHQLTTCWLPSKRFLMLKQRCSWIAPTVTCCKMVVISKGVSVTFSQPLHRNVSSVRGEGAVLVNRIPWIVDTGNEVTNQSVRSGP